MIHCSDTTLMIECFIHCFAKNVKKYRTQRKITQTELAEKLATSKQWVSDVERARKSVRLETVMKIAIALEINPSELILE